MKLPKKKICKFMGEVKERLGFCGKLKSICSGTKMERIISNTLSKPNPKGGGVPIHRRELRKAIEYQRRCF
jgi:hypothetical protein